MTHAPSLDPTQLRALAARCGLWVVDLLAWLADWLAGGKIGKVIRREARREYLTLRFIVGAVLMLLALKQRVSLPQPKRTKHPLNAPPGWRRGGVRMSVRTQMRFFAKGRTLRQRIRGLSDVLDHLDAWIARMAARLETTPTPAFVMACAPVEASGALADVDACAVDTS